MPSPIRPPSTMRALRLQTPHRAAEVSAADLSEDDDSDTDACMAAMESMHELEPEQAPFTRRRSSANPGPELGPGSSANQGAALGASGSSDANQGAALVATSSSGANQSPALGAGTSSGANQGPALGAAGAGAGGDRLEGQARAQRGQAWGPFKLAAVFRDGMCIGWGATCGRHRDGGGRGGLQCKKQMVFAGQSEEVVQCRLKKWLLAGYQIDPLGERCRAERLAIDARLLHWDIGEDLDALLAECQQVQGSRA